MGPVRHCGVLWVWQCMHRHGWVMSWFFFFDLLLLLLKFWWWLFCWLLLWWLLCVVLHRFELWEFSSPSWSSNPLLLSPEAPGDGEKDMEAYEDSGPIIDSKLVTEELVDRMRDVQMRAPVRDLLLLALPGTMEYPQSWLVVSSDDVALFSRTDTGLDLWYKSSSSSSSSLSPLPTPKALVIELAMSMMQEVVVVVSAAVTAKHVSSHG